MGQKMRFRMGLVKKGKSFHPRGGCYMQARFFLKHPQHQRAKKQKKNRFEHRRVGAPCAATWPVS